MHHTDVSIGRLWWVSGTTPACPGPGQAERGWLCIYSAEQANVSSPVVFDMEVSPPTVGTGITSSVTAADAYDLGTYTITAP
jgi:hypothetical protein